MKKKVLATVLVLCMIFSMLPIAALADFADTDGHWGKNAIDRWAAEGVLNGKGDDIFDPNGSMTRAEFAQMLCNLMGYTKKAANTFVDVPDGAWYADAILKLVAAGVLNGVGNDMAAPNAPITREQAAVMLARAFSLKAGSASLGYADAGDVSDWAVGAVAALTEKGMLNGVGDNQVAPQLYINRASVATLIDNMVVEYVTEDKTITGEVNGIIVVAGDAKVTFEDATVNAPVIVAPAAEGAEVELTGTTAAENVVVAAENASVTVGKDATAESVTAAADKTEVKVEGTVDTVAVEGEDAKVDVAGSVGTVAVTGEEAKVEVSGTVDTVAVEGEGAKVDVSGTVGTVSTEAPNTTVAVSGTVENVEVAEGADKTEITTTSTAKIDNVTTAAEDVKVSGTGEVGTVTADAGSVDVTTKGTEVANNGADKVTAGDKTVADGESETVTTVPSSGGGGGGGGGSSTTTRNASVTTAVFHDTRADVADKVAGKDYVSDNDLKAGYSVSNKVVDEVTEVTVIHKDVWQHQNANSNLGYWTGYAIKAPAGFTENTIAGYGRFTAKSDSPVLSSAPVEEIAAGVKGMAVYYDISNSTSTNNEYVAIKWTDKSEVEWYHVNLSGATCRHEVTNVQLKVVANLGDVKKLDVDVQKALCNQDFLDKTANTEKTNDMPWLVVTYSRNVASSVTFATTKDGSNTLTSGMDDTTSGMTINAKACQSWSMNPQTGSDGKLWGTKPAIISGTYGITLTAGGHTYTATAPKYDHDGEETVTVTFDSKGGSPVTSQTIAKNGTATSPSAPTKEGYTFENWYASSNLSGTAFDFATTIDSNKTLYAKYTANTYTIAFDQNNSNGSAISSITATYDAPINQTLPTPAPYTGYSFKEWNTAADGKGTKVTSDSKNLATTGTVTIYAIWTPDVYDITYILGGGTATGNPTKYTIETETITLKPATKAGYTFIGWFKTVEEEETEVTEITTGSIGALTLTAKYVKNPEVGAYGAGFSKTGITGAVNSSDKSKITITVTDQWNPNAAGGNTGMIGGADATAAPSGESAANTLWVGVKIKVSDEAIDAINGYSWCLYSEDGKPSATKGTFADGSTADGYVIMWVGLAGKNVKNDDIFWLVKNNTRNTTDTLGIYKGSGESAEFIGTITIQKVFPAPTATTTILPDGYVDP